MSPSLDNASLENMDPFNQARLHQDLQPPSWSPEGLLKHVLYNLENLSSTTNIPTRVELHRELRAYSHKPEELLLRLQHTIKNISPAAKNQARIELRSLY